MEARSAPGTPWVHIKHGNFTTDITPSTGREWIAVLTTAIEAKEKELMESPSQQTRQPAVRRSDEEVRQENRKADMASDSANTRTTPSAKMESHEPVRAAPAPVALQGPKAEVAQRSVSDVYGGLSADEPRHMAGVWASAAAIGSQSQPTEQPYSLSRSR